MAEKKKLWSTMKKVVKKSKDNPLRAKNAYTEYVISGGQKPFGDWKKDNGY